MQKYSSKLTLSRYFIAFIRKVDRHTWFSFSTVSCWNHLWLVTDIMANERLEGCLCWSSAWTFGVPRHTSFSNVWQECCPVAPYGSRLSTCRCPPCPWNKRWTLLLKRKERCCCASSLPPRLPAYGDCLRDNARKSWRCWTYVTIDDDIDENSGGGRTVVSHTCVSNKEHTDCLSFFFAGSAAVSLHSLVSCLLSAFSGHV